MAASRMLNSAADYAWLYGTIVYDIARCKLGYITLVCLRT